MSDAQRLLSRNIWRHAATTAFVTRAESIKSIKTLLENQTDKQKNHYKIKKTFVLLLC